MGCVRERWFGGVLERKYRNGMSRFIYNRVVILEDEGWDRVVGWNEGV